MLLAVWRAHCLYFAVISEGTIIMRKLVLSLSVAVSLNFANAVSLRAEPTAQQQQIEILSKALADPRTTDAAKHELQRQLDVVKGNAAKEPSLPGSASASGTDTGSGPN